jgi:hypothetical protein
MTGPKPCAKTYSDIERMAALRETSNSVMISKMLGLMMEVAIELT